MLHGVLNMPPELWIVGDWIDQPEPSRWSRGNAGEYARTLQASVNEATDLLADLRHIMGRRPIHFKTGNHDIRVEKYVSQYAPALRSLSSLSLEEMLDLDRLNITLHRKPVELAPNWLLAHGDEGALSRIAGGTAMNLAKRFGKSVVCGHTHRLGLQAFTTSVNGRAIAIAQWNNLIENNLQLSSNFKKGHVPWCKGQKLSSEHIAKLTGVFKKGQQPHNTLPIGSIRNINNYNEIKYKNHKWMALARYNWEQVHGPVPNDMCVSADYTHTNLLSQ